jgi:hypothetical protein
MLFKFLDVDFYCKKLTPITSTSVVLSNGKFHDDGVFSEKIFGRENSIERRTTFSYIDLNSLVINPIGLDLITRLDRNVTKYISGELLFSVDDGGMLVKDDSGVAGISEFIKNFDKIKFRGGTPERDDIIRVLKKSYNNKILFIDKVPVIPADMRPAFRDPETNELEMDPINDYYLTILKRSIAIKTSGTSGPFYDTMNYYLQMAVSDCVEFIKTRLSKKTGLIRNQILGKRINFSARAVISNSPTLRPDEIGVPFKSAVMLLEPFIIHAILHRNFVPSDDIRKLMLTYNNMDLSIDNIKKLLIGIRNGDNIPEKLYDIIYEITDKCTNNRLVLAKRDPSLHQENVRAFKIVLTKGNTIEICNMLTSGYNADFDGDQMALFHPLSNEAQQEARKLLRAQSNKNFNSVTVSIEKEGLAGIFVMTKDYKMTKSPVKVTDSDLMNAKDPATPVIYRSRATTMGRAIFNYMLPHDHPFVDRTIDKKEFNKLMVLLFNKYGIETFYEVMHKIEHQANKFTTLTGSTFTIDDLIPTAAIKKEIKDLGTQSVEGVVDSLDKAQTKMKEDYEKKQNGLYDLCNSGASRGWDQISQMVIAKGIVSDIQGNLLPTIKGSFSSGLTPAEMFNASYTARKGMVNRAVSMSDSGYTTRQLIYLLNSVEADWLIKDCGTTKTLSLRLTKDMISRLTGRYVIESGRLIRFDPLLYKDGDTIQLRSPVYCKSLKVCHTCYGDLLGKHNSPYIGIIAAQNIGERTSQTVMSSFHKGVASLSKRNIIKDILDNDPHSPSERIKRAIKQVEYDLICSESGTLHIEMENYEPGDDIIINEDSSSIWVKNLISKYTLLDGTSFNIIIDTPIVLQTIKAVINEKEYIEIEYSNGDTIGQIPIEQEEMTAAITYLRRLVGGKEIFFDTPHLLMKIYKILEKHTNMDLVHFEVLLSQCLRDKDRPILPARIGKDPDHPVMASIKKNIFTTGIIGGLGFENISKALENGLVAKFELEPSILEKVLLGEITVDPNLRKKQ